MSAIRTAAINTWRGLIQRRLWPVALLLVLALVAVPLLLLARPEADQAPALAQAEVAGDPADLIAQPLVAAASPSDRERVRRVLGDRKDPFKPSNQPKRKRTSDADTARTSDDSGVKGSPGASGGAGSGSAIIGAGKAPAAGGSPAPAPVPSVPGSPPAEDGSPARERRPAGSLTVRWGSSENEDLEKIDIERLDPLPSPEEPVLVYLGVSDDGDAAVFLVDAGVTVDGDARCRPAPDDCQTYALRAGETAFVEVEREGDDKAQFQLDLVKIHGRKAERAKAARRSGAGEARVARRALRFLGRDEREHRSIARPYTPELIIAAP